MFEYDEDSKKVDFSHNPFSMPNFAHDAFLKLDKSDDKTILGITAFQYDIVCNGVELSSGAIRNHLPDIMYKAFAIAGYSQADVAGATFILTGWGVHKPSDTWNKSGAPYGSYFDFGRHEPGTHSVMGKSYSAFVRNDGKLNDLKMCITQGDQLADAYADAVRVSLP